MDKKQTLLNEFLKMSEGKTSDDMLPLLMAFSQKAKKEKISFTKEESMKIIENLTKDMPPERTNQLKMLANMMFG